jgi:hypothetical protein
MDKLNGLPERLRAPGGPLPPPRLELYDMGNSAAPLLAKEERVQIVTVPRLSAVACSEEATLFRMRWQSSCRCRARVLYGGKVTGYSGRMPGLLEEAVIALALGQPLYVFGCEPGAARAVGELLGLLLVRSTTAIGSTQAPQSDCWHLFHPPGFGHLPVSVEEAISFIAGHAIGGPSWVDNGLSVDENRDLFSADMDAALRLLTTGLTRVFAA